jgi:hypothetical protein
MLGATNRRLALTPVAKPCAAPAHDLTRIQTKHLSALPARAADELQEEATGAHENVDYANLGRNWSVSGFLKGDRDAFHAGRQFTRSAKVCNANRRKFVYVHETSTLSIL